MRWTSLAISNSGGHNYIEDFKTGKEWKRQWKLLHGTLFQSSFPHWTMLHLQDHHQHGWWGLDICRLEPHLGLGRWRCPAKLWSAQCLFVWWEVFLCLQDCREFNVPSEKLCSCREPPLVCNAALSPSNAEVKSFWPRFYNLILFVPSYISRYSPVDVLRRHAPIVTGVIVISEPWI